MLDHTNTASCLVKSLRGMTVLDRFGQNFLRYWHMSKKRRTAAFSAGLGNSLTASTSDASYSTLLSVSLYPINVTLLALNWSFFADSRRLQSLLLSRRATRFRSWSMSASSFVSPHPNKQMSSAMLMML